MAERITRLQPLPASLMNAVTISNDIIFYVHFANSFSTSLRQFKTCQALKIGLFNKTLFKDRPQQQRNVDAFDFVIQYEGPRVSNEEALGSLGWLQQQNGENEDLNRYNVLPVVYKACTTILDQIVSIIPKLDRFYLVSQDEAALMQIALLREKYNLPLGMKPHRAEIFLSKVSMLETFKKLGVPFPKSIKVNTKDLREMSENEVMNLFSSSDCPAFPLFIKPTVGTCSQETQTVDTFDELKDWINKSDSLIYPGFLFQEKLAVPQYLALVVATRNGILVPAVSRTNTSYELFMTRSQPISEEHLQRDDVMYKRVEALVQDVFQKLMLGPEDNGCYFIEFMHKSDGSLVLIEVQARFPGGFFTTALAEMMHGSDVESYSLAWPFIDYMEDSTKIICRFARTIIYPTLGGTVVQHHTPGQEMFNLGSRLGSINHYGEIGNHLPAHPTSLVNVLSELSIIGEDRGAVRKSTERLQEHFIPVLTV